MIHIPTIRRFHRRLYHWKYGITELAVINPSVGIIATGFFDNEDVFVKACRKYNGRYNIYAGRNPRPRWLPKTCMNYLDTRYKQRARDNEIYHITAISLDIDPIRPKGTASTQKQHKKAIEFALKLHNEIGGWVDDSGNGSYLWIPFATPIKIARNRHEIKRKCRQWQANIVEVHQPEKHGLRIDGCFDLSRLKKVLGTMSVKGIHRLSRFVVVEQARDDKVRNAILSLTPSPANRSVAKISPTRYLPGKFLRLLKANPAIQELWITPNSNNDASMHDWMLGCELIKSGISRREDLARIIMANPFGKYQRDGRFGYVQSTVCNLMNQRWQ